MGTAATQKASREPRSCAAMTSSGSGPTPCGGSLGVAIGKIGPAVVSSNCDRSIRLLMVTLALHRRGEAALATGPPVRGRLKVLATDSANSRVRRESVLVRSVSIMESHVHAELVSRLAPLAPNPRSPLVETLYAQFEERGTMLWDETANYFKKHIDSSIKIKSSPHWHQVNAVIEARNAVVHGLGKFTNRQTRRNVPKVVANHLTTLDFDVSPDGSRIMVTAEALESTVILLRTYLEWLDGVLATIP